jgi:myosin-heavy-chain kinase
MQQGEPQLEEVVAEMPRKITFDAFRWEYDARRDLWVEVPTKITVDVNAPNVGSGGMRHCFVVEQQFPDGSMSPYAAKFFKNIPEIGDVYERHYFDEAMSQCLCEVAAAHFNMCRPRGCDVISFLSCNVVRISRENIDPDVLVRSPFFSYSLRDTRDIVFGMEAFYNGGNFTKYNSNYGEVYEEGTFGTRITPQQLERHQRLFLVAEAFSHFTWAWSNGKILVCDLQGINDLFTDPQILTSDDEGFGMGNMGREGIKRWKAAHECNDICRAMHLPQVVVDAEPPLDAADRDRPSFDDIRSALFAHTAMQQESVSTPRPTMPGWFASMAEAVDVRCTDHVLDFMDPQDMTEHQQVALAIKRSLQ